MRIAKLSAAEIRPYRALMLEAYVSAPDAFTSTAEERAAEPDSWWARRLEDPSGKTASFGAYEGDELVGTVALEFESKPKTRHKALLIGMYVKPTARGAGVGAALIKEALAFVAARREIKVVTLTVTHGNTSAMRLYESAGFKQFGIEPMAILGRAGYLSKVHMWRQVGGGEAAA